MPLNKFGYPQLYPTKTTAGLSGTGRGFVYEQSSDILDDNHFNGEGDISSSSGGVWVFETDGPTSVQIFKNSDTADSIGGCDMDFAATVKRGYAYRKDDPRDIELMFAIKFEEADSDNGFAIEGPTGRHSGDGCCQGFAYKLDVDFQSSPAEFRYRKEMWHVSNHTDPRTNTWAHSKANFQLLGRSNYVGIAYVHYVKDNGGVTGHNTTKSVVLETWFNPNPDANKLDWTMIKRTEDRGNWGDDGDHCNGDKDQIGAWSNSNFRLKCNADGGVFRIKNLSLREIDPNRSFDDSPSEGGGDGGGSNDPTEVTGVLSLKYDINVIRDSPCSATGNKLFYESPRDEEDNTRYWAFNIDQGDGVIKHRIGIVAKDSLSSIVNQDPILEADFWLWKTGSPTGTLSVKIRNSNNTVKATIGTLDVSTLTTSPVLTQFINLSNGYRMVPGDKILAEFTSGDDSNYVKMGKRNTLSATSGLHTKATYFDTLPATDVYLEFSGREIPGKLWN